MKLRIRKNNKNMSFLNTQLIKKTCHYNYFYDIINPQKIIKHEIFKYAINEKICHHVFV